MPQRVGWQFMLDPDVGAGSVPLDALGCPMLGVEGGESLHVRTL